MKIRGIGVKQTEYFSRGLLRLKQKFVIIVLIRYDYLYMIQYGEKLPKRR
jgi:hypothetical protein